MGRGGSIVICNEQFPPSLSFFAGNKKNKQRYTFLYIYIILNILSISFILFEPYPIRIVLLNL